MRDRFQKITCLLPVLFGVLLVPVAGPAEDSVRYSREIQPLFAEKCLDCHGPDKQKGKLRLDDPDSVARVLEDDELIYRVTTDDPDDRMPPEGPGLSSAEIENVKSWVAAGAPFERHWAYRPLSEEEPPAVKNEAWVSNPIDRFVLARLEREGIAPSPEANRHTLIRRLSYDLIGLPPTPEEVDAFAGDERPDAYLRLVRRLLDSKHFGERWGRHWLDKARYADSDGYEKDRPRPNAWHYRDWVIDAINVDLPMDRFTVEQLAGDLLPDAGHREKLATAFHRQTLTNTEGGTDKEEFRVEAVFDRTETTGTIWLGLTLNCARCHSHKYDAIEQSEYYRLFAFFNNGDETNLNLPNSEEAMEKYRKARAEHEAKLRDLDQRIEAARAGHEAAFASWQKKTSERLASSDPVAFHDLREVSASASIEGVTFEVASGGVVKQAGANPDGTIVTTFKARAGELPAKISGIRLDALPDDSLPQKGPGRAPNGNFVLNEVELFVAGKKRSFSGAEADFSQPKFDVQQLIDGKTEPASGWAVGGKAGKAHHAILTLGEPLALEPGSEVTVRLTRNYTGGHTLGRFRLRLMTGENTRRVAPEEIRKFLTTAAGKRNPEQEKALLDHFLKTAFPPTKALLAQREALVKKAPREPVTPVRVIARRSSPRETHVLERGSFLTPSDRVEPAGLSVLPPIPSRKGEGQPDRLDFAHWLMSPENPLPPRVLANQVWEKLFGAGLVRTMNDFGVRGDRPEYPRLLDWLGREYSRLGWSRKRLIETIVLSSTYRQQSVHREDLRDRDPGNHLLARQNRFRVSAEVIRDITLSVSGLLSDEVGGPSVFPPMPPEIAALSYANNFKWKTSAEGDRYRRGMYTFFKRTAPHPNLVTFDCPDSNTTSVSRRISNTPLQALTLLNNEVYVEAAQAFARRILETGAKGDRERIGNALRFCVARPPQEGEVDRFLSLLETSRRWFASHPEEAAEMTRLHRPEGVAVEEAAAWVSLARIVLNLDEFITRE